MLELNHHARVTFFSASMGALGYFTCDDPTTDRCCVLRGASREPSRVQRWHWPTALPRKALFSLDHVIFHSIIIINSRLKPGKEDSSYPFPPHTTTPSTTSTAQATATALNNAPSPPWQSSQGAWPGNSSRTFWRITDGQDSFVGALF